MSPEPSSRPHASRIPIVAALLAGSILLSRVLGVVREMVLAAQVGAGAEVDAYRAAFQLPDILNHFLAGGAFAVAFVPFYLRVRESRGSAAAQRCRQLLSASAERDNRGSAGHLRPPPLRRPAGSSGSPRRRRWQPPH